MKTSLHLLALLFLLIGVAGAEPLYLERPDGSFITYYLDQPEEGDFPLVVYLQGSECLRVSHKYGPQIEQLVESGVGVLRVEKPGLNASVRIGDCPQEYLRLNTPQRRVLDLLLVLAHLRASQPDYNGSTGLLGGSEGAMIAALAAPHIPKLKGIVLLSGGGGNTFGEEVVASVEGQMRRGGLKGHALEEELGKMRKEIAEVLKEPVPNKEWASDGELGRNTYLWWSNAWNLKLSTPLKLVAAPVLSYHGQQDAGVSLESAQLLESSLADAGKKNFELRVYDGGHAPPDQILSEAGAWLVAHLAD